MMTEDWLKTRGLISLVTGSGVMLIAEERRRQTAEEEITDEHDDRHVLGELGSAAVAYVLGRDLRIGGIDGGSVWPWDEADFNPSDDPIRNLTRAGALIAAEIDRLVRKKEAEEAVTVEVRKVDVEAAVRWIRSNAPGGPAEAPGGLPDWVMFTYGRLLGVLDVRSKWCAHPLPYPRTEADRRGTVTCSSCHLPVHQSRYE